MKISKKFPRSSDWDSVRGAFSSTFGGLRLLQLRAELYRPGWIDSRSPEEQAKEPPKASDHAQHPVGRVGRVEDISQFVLFLLSSQTGFITGQEFIIDGGMTRKMIYED